MSEDKYIELASFHIDNGGITVTIAERWRTLPRSGGQMFEMRMMVGMSTFGVDVVFDMPLPGKVFVSWLRDALGRAAARFDDPAYSANVGGWSKEKGFELATIHYADGKLTAPS